MSANFSYCIANYLFDKSNICLSEELVFIFGGCYHLSLRSKSSGHVVNNRYLSELNDSVHISNSNHLAIQNFTSTLGAVLRVEPRNPSRDIKWIVEDYLADRNYKTLVTLPSTILESPSSNLLSNQNLWALMSPESLTAGSSIDGVLNIELTKERVLRRSSKSILEIWKDQVSNRILGPNRFKIIPPVYHDLKIAKKILLKNALMRMYLSLNTGNFNIGPNIFVLLRENLKKNPSVKNIQDHRKILSEAISDSDFAREDYMGRKYASHCFETVGLKEGIDSLIHIADSLLSSHEVWKSAILELICPKKSITAKDLLDMYWNLENSEREILNRLKQTLV
ncbi:hypothetical protein [Sphingobacterium sp. HSC-15S19]|uniref:hypothetical protein n=1 Tax=Sphingobacterium sp. HSC-15S19 TaxID=2910971 RepID=UPI003D21E05A